MPFSCWRSTERCEPAWMACSRRSARSASFSCMGFVTSRKLLAVGRSRKIDHNARMADATPTPPVAAMRLPIQPPIQPMLAKLARSIPGGDDWLFEPKWDGFRCIVYRDGDRRRADLPQAPTARSLLPRTPRTVARALPGRCVVDGEIVVADARPERASTSTRCCNVFIRPNRGSIDWPRRPRRPSWRSICWRTVTRRCSTDRWPIDASPSSMPSPRTTSCG